QRATRVPPLDEAAAARAGLDGRELPFERTEFATRLLRPDRLEDAEVDVGESLDVSLRVAPGPGGPFLRRRRQTVFAAPEVPARAVRRRVDEQVRILLPPVQRALGAV